MERILLTCVGRQDPFNERDHSEGPILSFCRYLLKVEKYRMMYSPQNIRAVYLLSSAEKPGSTSPTQRNAEDTRKAMEDRGWCSVNSIPSALARQETGNDMGDGGWRVYHRPLDVLDPTDYREILPAMRDAVQSIIDDEGTECDYLVNVTPGTGQMEAVWLSLYNAGLLPKATLLQVKAPWDESDVEKRIRKVDVASLAEANYIQLATDYMEEFSFKAAAGMFLELAHSGSSVRRGAADFLSKLSRAYMLWDNVDYPQAEERISSLTRESIYQDDAFRELRKIVESQRTVLARLVGKGREEFILDLYHNAYRRHKAGSHADCVWLCWSLYENYVINQAIAAVQREYGAQYNFAPERFRYFVENKAPSDLAASLLSRSRGIPSHLDEWHGRMVIKHCNDPIERELRTLDREISKLRHLRNGSIHQMEPVSKKGANEALRTAREICLIEVEKKERIGGHPFSESVIEDLVGRVIPNLLA